MLVLSRKKNEQVVIGDSIVITIVDIRGDKVRLGIEAPADIPLHRTEVHRAIYGDKKIGETRKESELEKDLTQDNSKLENNIEQSTITEIPNKPTLYQQLKSYLNFRKQGY